MTRFRYSAPITQSVMELRMHPRTENDQRCLNFQINLTPNAHLIEHRDYLGNIVHHFDIPGQHKQLTITAQALVDMRPHLLPPDSLPPESWAGLDALQAQHYDMLIPSRFTEPTDLLQQLARDIGAERRTDPLTLLRELNAAIYRAFDYAPESTEVDSPIDQALEQRRGVCQDFAHIMIALARQLGIPCRYVSGYLFYPKDNKHRSVPDATHAWVECFLPDLGWVGFDPTNNLLCNDRHIRVAVGRDYADVPPTRGIFKGSAETELAVAVRVSLADEPISEAELKPGGHWYDDNRHADETDSEQQEQQQQ
jgi:transglutaminase-like putative cysteine protease